MSPFESDVILPALRRLNAVGAIQSVALAVQINKAERTARYYLRRLELAGVVCRPEGPRKGWIVRDLQLQRVQGGI